MPRLPEETKTHLVQETHEQRLLALPNVIGVGTGFRMRGGEFTSEICIQVFVERKVRADELEENERVPERLRDAEGTEVRTDVIEAPIPDAQQSDDAHYRPVPGGCCIGPEASMIAGTLGGFAFDNQDNQIVLLSCNHVIGGLGAMPTLRRVVQPARGFGGTLPTDIVGRLTRQENVNTVALPTAGNIPTSVVDAAIASIDLGINVEQRVITIGDAIFELREPALNMNVQKRGRTTRFTNNGRITTTRATLNCRYQNQTRISRIQNAFRITSTDGNPFGLPGDSGSLIFAQEPGDLDNVFPVVGLYYAGGSFQNGTPFNDANEIIAVFGALNLSPFGFKISPRSLSFGAVPQKDLRVMRFALVNNTVENVQVSIEASKPPPSNQPKSGFYWSTLKVRFDPGESRWFSVHFSPRAEANFLDQVLINTDPGGVVVVRLRGRGLPDNIHPREQLSRVDPAKSKNEDEGL